jgi:ribosomal protein S18 acetylase RimI-like enzyme
MTAIEEWLAGQGVRVVALETPADEGGARQFYEQHGYQLGGRVRGYYHGKLDAFSMVKRLGTGGAAPGVSSEEG